MRATRRKWIWSRAEKLIRRGARLGGGALLLRLKSPDDARHTHSFADDPGDGERVPSLSTVVLVDHRSELVELWTRADDDWMYARFGAGEQCRRDAIHCTLAADAV